MRCNDDDLTALLDSSDSSGGHSDVTEHLESCSHCQTRLQRLAADAPHWQEMKHWLAEDQALPDQHGLHRRWRRDTNVTESDWFQGIVEQLLEPPRHPEMLGRIDRYEVERVLGWGGMGIVFKAYDSELNRPIAIKVLAPHLSGSGSARQRFAREARAAAAIVHEHVVAIHNVESQQSVPFLVMQYVAGESLQERLNAHGPLDLREILRIGMQAAAGLSAAHDQGLVHRDVKPSNILLNHGVERALLTDFGLARASDDANLTRSGYVAGTPHYMSPEQARGEVADQRSDLFGLGAVLYAMCTGRPPFRAETTYGVLKRINDEQPSRIDEVNVEIPAWLAVIVEKLMAKQPKDRFGSAAEVATLLAGCLAHVQQPSAARLPKEVDQLLAARRPSRQSLVPERKGTSRQRGVRRLVAPVVALCLFGMSALGAALWQATEPPEISGAWLNEESGRITLVRYKSGGYVGELKGPGLMDHLELKWSRLERRFNGSWSGKQNAAGRLSMRVVDDELRGAWTSNRFSQQELGLPRMADCFWKRSLENGSHQSPSPAKELHGTSSDSSLPTINESNAAPSEHLEQLNEGLWIDRNEKRVVMDAEVCLTRGPLEMLACPSGSKEHESILAVKTRPSFVHAALLAVGAKPGKPAQLGPNFKPASGPVVEVLLEWTDKNGVSQTVPAQQWLRNAATGNAMDSRWIFVGSSFREQDGKDFYQADQGDFICVSNFPTATLDIDMQSSSASSHLLFEAFTERIPPKGTAVKIILAPQFDGS